MRRPCRWSGVLFLVPRFISLRGAIEARRNRSCINYVGLEHSYCKTIYHVVRWWCSRDRGAISIPGLESGSLLVLCQIPRVHNVHFDYYHQGYIFWRVRIVTENSMQVKQDFWVISLYDSCTKILWPAEGEPCRYKATLRTRRELQ